MAKCTRTRGLRQHRRPRMLARVRSGSLRTGTSPRASTDDADHTSAPPSPDLRTIELTPDREAQLQRFFVANPQYYEICYGEPPGPGEAHEEIHGGLERWAFENGAEWLRLGVVVGNARGE